MNRVGRKRMSSYSRERSIVMAIAEITLKQKRIATLSSIAERLRLTPSSYLLGILKSMAVSGKIEFYLEKISQNRTRYCWNVITEEKSGCELPWRCDNLCMYQSSFHVCIGDIEERHVAK